MYAEMEANMAAEDTVQRLIETLEVEEADAMREPSRNQPLPASTSRRTKPRNAGHACGEEGDELRVTRSSSTAYWTTAAAVVK